MTVFASLNSAYAAGATRAIADYLKHAAFESKEDVLRTGSKPAADPQQAASADTGAESKNDAEKPMNTQGWISSGETVKEPERNSTIGLV